MRVRGDLLVLAPLLFGFLLVGTAPGFGYGTFVPGPTPPPPGPGEPLDFLGPLLVLGFCVALVVVWAIRSRRPGPRKPERWT